MMLMMLISELIEFIIYLNRYCNYSICRSYKHVLLFVLLLCHQFCQHPFQLLHRHWGNDTCMATQVREGFVYRHRQMNHSWWRHQMETFSALMALCAGNSPVTGEFPSQRPVTRSFDVCFYLRLNKRLSEQSWGWGFETPSRWLWRHCNVELTKR